MYIDHIAIWTGNLEKEKDFFLKYFDCSANDKYENNSKKFSSYFIIFQDGARIELMHREDINEKMAGEKLGIAHIAINVACRQKVDELTKVLEQDGHIVISLPRITGDGYYESVILDPENNVIELLSNL